MRKNKPVPSVPARTEEPGRDQAAAQLLAAFSAAVGPCVLAPGAPYYQAEIRSRETNQTANTSDSG